jgi:MoaA/NifB/PqqE/SkfB family radical SAM enzyme
MKLMERLRGVCRSPLLASRLLLQGRYDFVYDQMLISQRRMSWTKRTNIVRSGLNLLYRRIHPWGMPLHMQFELINYCNLHCPVCPTGNRELQRLPQRMDLSLFRDTMAEVGPYLLTSSLWGWGESLLHPQFADFLREAQKYKVAFFLSTNGQNLDRDEVIEAIVEYPPAFLIVAIDGITDETNSRYRVGARLEPILEGMHRLVEKKKRMHRPLPILQMRFLVMKHNQHELPKVEEFAASNGFEMLALRILSLVDSNAGLAAHRWLTASVAEFEKDSPGRESPDFVCMNPFWFPTLFVDGTVVGCDQDFDAQKPIGRIGPGVTFRDIWTSSEAAAVRRTVRNSSESLSFCRNCPAKGWGSTDGSYKAVWIDPRREKEFVMEG